MKSSKFDQLFKSEEKLLDAEHNLVFFDFGDFDEFFIKNAPFTPEHENKKYIDSCWSLADKVYFITIALVNLKNFPEQDSYSYSNDLDDFIRSKNYPDLNLNPIIYYGIESYKEYKEKYKHAYKKLENKTDLLANFLLEIRLMDQNNEKYKRILHEKRITINNFKRSVEKNISSTKDYINKLVAHSRINVIRLLLFFNSDKQDVFKRIKYLLPLFLKEIRKKNLGYLWIIETRISPYSVHFMVIQKYCEENNSIPLCIAIADQIGRQWVNLGRPGELDYFRHESFIDINCQRSSELNKLHLVIESILKYGYFFNIKGKFRLLGRGEISKTKR